MIHAVGGDHDLRTVSAVYEFPLSQIPQRELEMLTWTADESLDVAEKDTGRTGLGSTAGVQKLQHGDAEQLLGFDVVFGAQRLRNQARSLLLTLRTMHVVLGASFGIPEDMVCLGQ